MRNTWKTTIVLAATLLLVAGFSQGPSEDSIALSTVRSYRSDARTEVDAFLQVPYAWLEPSGAGAESRLSYGVIVRVTDSTGLVLLKDSWKNHAPAGVREPGASGMDIFHFSVAPGRYRIAVEVEDSVSGRRGSSGVDVEGFSSAPVASDLLLSPHIRYATANDSVPRAAEVRWGKMLVTAAAELQLTPLRSQAYYLLEAYTPDSTSGTLELRVRDSTGKQVINTPASKVSVPQGGGVLRGELDLAGLPPGRYSMGAHLKLGAASVERSAPFLMRAVGETLEKDVARRTAARSTDAGYFGSMNNDSLVAASEALQAIATGSELAGWDKSLSINAKRNFLVRFWAGRDPTPDTPQNEARQAFYDKVDYANRTYKVPGRITEPGWKTDRGRVFLRNGTPSEVLQQGAHGGGGRVQSRALPYEVWHYTGSGKDRYYIFVDRTGVGAFSLVRSNDVRENSMPNWSEYFSQDDIDQLDRFLGRDVFR